MNSGHHPAVLDAVFLRLARWFDATHERARRSEIESFLSQATNTADLEARILEFQHAEKLVPFADDVGRSESGVSV